MEKQPLRKVKEEGQCRHPPRKLLKKNRLAGSTRVWWNLCVVSRGVPEVGGMGAGCYGCRIDYVPCSLE